MIKSGYIEKKRPTISQDKRQVFFKVTETGFNILKAQTEKNIEVFRDFYNEISESQRENFRTGVRLLRELSPAKQQCTEALVKKYTKDFADDDDFLSVLEDLSYFSFSILDRNAKEFSSVCANPKNELKALTEHQLQIIFCVRVLELDTISKLSDFLGASSSTLSIAVSKLVNMGYLKKTYPDMDSDGRFVYIKPTEKTIVMFDEAYVNAQKHIKADMLKKLSNENLKKFISGMDYLLKVFE
jgi:DNA-binding MarR family transcriptional regulator